MSTSQTEIMAKVAELRVQAQQFQRTGEKTALLVVLREIRSLLNQYTENQYTEKGTS